MRLSPIKSAEEGRELLQRRIPSPPAAGAPLFGEPAAERETREPTPLVSDKAALERAGQAVLPGMEASARQAQAGRDAAGPRGGQKAANEGLFAPKEAEQKRLFQGAQQGKISVFPGDVRSIITMLLHADASTFLHEIAHDWLKHILQDSLHPLAPQDLRDDATVIRQWLKRPDDWTGFHANGDPDAVPHERFARTFEQYLREGGAPSPALARVFAKLKEWIGTIYAAFKRVPGSRINDDIRGVFDRLFTDEPRRTVYAPEPEVRPNLPDIHEADATETGPREADATADRIANERRTYVTTKPPEVTSGIAAAQGAARGAGGEPGAAAHPGAETGAGGGGRENVAPGGGRPEPVAAGGNRGAERGPVGGGRGEAPQERAGVAGGASPTAGEQRRPVSGATPGPGQLAPGPAIDLTDAGSERFVDKAGNIRPENIENSADFIQAAKESAKRNQDFWSVRPTGTMGDMIALANDLGMEPGEITEKHLAKLFGDMQDMGPRIWALRSVIPKQSSLVRSLWATATETKAPEDIARATVEMARFDMMMTTLSRATAISGRTLGMSFRNLQEWKSAKDLNQFFKDNAGKDLFQLKMIAQLGARYDTPAKIAKFIRDGQKRSFGRMLVEYWVNGLISGLPTHVTYVIGEAILAAVKAGPETTAAWAIGEMRARMGRTGERVRLGEVGAQFGAAFRELPAAAQAAIEAYRSGATTLLPGETARPLMPFQGDTSLTVARNMTNAHVTWSEVRGDAYALIQGMRDGMVAAGELIAAGGEPGAPMFGASYSPLGQIPDIQYRGVTALPLGTLARLPSRNVAAIHSTFRSLNYSMEINRLAYRMASVEREAAEAAGRPMSDVDFAARTADLRQNPTEEMMAVARGAATELTLMGEAGRWVQNLIRWVGTPVNLPILGETPILKFVDPFVHIAANIMDQSLVHRTPLGLLSPEIRADLWGHNGPIAQDTAGAKMLVGSAIAVAFGGLAAQGLMTGSGPADPRKAAMWRTMYQPHSVRIGDFWYDMHRLGPMGMLASVAADMYDVAHQIGAEDADVVGKSLMHAFAQNILDESFMRGPSDLIKAVTDPDRYGSGYVRTFLSSFVPYSVGLAQTARATDPYSRQARTIMDAILQKIPGMSESLFPRRDIWGAPMPSGDALLAPGITAIYAQRMSHDPVNQELVRLGMGPAPVERTIRNVRLTDQQYDDFARVAGTAAKMRLDVIVNSPTFKLWPDESRRDVIDLVFKQSREAAVGWMFKKYPQIPRDATLQQMARLRGETVR